MMELDLNFSHLTPRGVASPPPPQPFQITPEFDSYDKTDPVKNAAGSRRNGGVQEAGFIASANWPGPGSWRLTPRGIQFADGSFIPPGAILLSALQAIGNNKLIGNSSGGSASPSEISLDASLAFVAGALARAALTGDVTASAGSNSTTIASAAVTNAKMANMAQQTVKGRAVGAGTGAPVDLTASQAKEIIAQAGATSFAAYAVGTAYSLTNAFAKLNFGTTSPAISITTAGTYILFARVRLDYNGATFAANQAASFKIRRTNNTAADISNAAAALLLDIVTTFTGTAMLVPIPVAIYTTANTNDALEIQGKVATVPSAGSVDCVEAELVALRVL